MTFTLEDAMVKYPEISYWHSEFLKHNTTAKQAEQEPVGRWNWNEAKFEWLTKFNYYKHHMTPLYAAPVRTKDLMDEDIQKLRHKIDWTAEWSYVNFARAVIAADREKNK